MSEVCDLLDIPPKGKNRQFLLGKKFGVSQEAARKWLSGLSIPEIPQCIVIAKEAKVCFEWLMTGRGPRDIAPEDDAQLQLHAQLLGQIRAALKPRAALPEAIRTSILALIGTAPMRPDITRKILDAENLIETPETDKEKQ